MRLNRRLPRGLYAITRGDDLTSTVAAAIDGGASVIQYRDKSGDNARRLAEASVLSRLCERRDIPLLINDDIALARAVGAAGVHLGRDDPSLGQARARLGDTAIIGASCYNRIDLAERAIAAGADYIAFGRFFPSRSKPDAVQADLDLLREARRRFRVPIVAIGGITPENGSDLIAAGADCLAVIDAVFGQPDIRASTQRFQTLFTRSQTA